MSCKYDSISLEDLGVHTEQICEERVTQIIFELAETFRLPVRILTPAEVKEAAEETYLGIHPDDREDLLNLTMTELARRDIVDADRDAGTIADVMQDVAAQHHLATVEG
ncbi:hypothetical protein ACTXL8_14140 [Glutamicibacter arilaitensis]|uniref:hypothetical protein n=1 Tax=Glutamicibacter arilaitensis TaxID=256701 RepID=UPI003FD6A12F